MQVANVRNAGAALITIVPYVLTHLTQMWLEVKGMRYSLMAPAIPIVYMYYRLLQLVRAFWLLANVYQDTRWLVWLFSFLATFWVYDTGAVVSFLPWTYNWHLFTGVPQPKHG